MGDSNMQPHTRRTRFVCISDTHNRTVKLPKGDVLIHCGDITNQGSFTELSKQVEWLEKADFECKIVIAGNHDLTLDTAFFEQYGAYFHNNAPQDPIACRNLLTQSKSLTYLQHEARTVKLASPSGPQTTFTVFGSPYSPEHGIPNWAFQYSARDEAAADALWDRIPLDTDVLVTHGPARTHRDEALRRGAVGCEALRRAMWRVRPRLALCGHVHEARGVERARWDLGRGHARYTELGAAYEWRDPGQGNGKNSLVDLTAKGGVPLDNDGSRAVARVEVPVPQASSSLMTAEPGSAGDANVAAAAAAAVVAGASPGIGTRGLSGDPESARSDQSALAGRLGRKETCIVNCAIKTKRGGPSSGLNKAIVVDLDLPVWEA